MMVDDFVNTKLNRVHATDLGLDERCGKLWVDDTCIVCDENNLRALSYYGGFEYIDDEYKKTLNGYTIFTVSGDKDDDRVQDHITMWMDKERTTDEA